MKDMFIIDLSKKNLKVEDYLADDIVYDLKHFKLKDPLKLSNNDFKVFNTSKEASEWLAKYNKILNGLDNNKICKSRDLPAILLKRKYMVQALMGEKMQTYRKYKKDWNDGQLINFHDQTFFLTVVLTSIKFEKGLGYCYRYTLPK